MRHDVLWTPVTCTFGLAVLPCVVASFYPRPRLLSRLPSRARPSHVVLHSSDLVRLLSSFMAVDELMHASALCRASHALFDGEVKTRLWTPLLSHRLHSALHCPHCRPCLRQPLH